MNSILLRRAAVFVIAGASFAGATCPVQAATSCRILNDDAIYDLSIRGDQALSSLRDAVDSDLLLAEVTVPADQRSKIHPYTEATSKFLDNVQAGQLFAGFFAESLAPSEQELNVNAHPRDRDATQAAYRARRDAMALLAMLPQDKAFGDPVLQASAKVRAAIRAFINMSAPFVANDNCKAEKERSRLAALKAKASTGQKVVECRLPGPLPDLSDQECAQFIAETQGVSALCVDSSDESGSCNVEVPPAPKAAAAADGICSDPQSVAANGNAPRADEALANGGDISGGKSAALSAGH